MASNLEHILGNEAVRERNGSDILMHNIMIVRSDFEQGIIDSLKEGRYTLSFAQPSEIPEKLEKGFYSVLIVDRNQLPNGSLIEKVRGISPNTRVLVTAKKYDGSYEEMVLRYGAYHVVDSNIMGVRLENTVKNAIEDANKEKDGKTGFYNKDSFVKYLQIMMDTTPRPRGSGDKRRNDFKYLATLLVDLDNFKVINDKYGGHVDGGDVALRSVADVMRESFNRQNTEATSANGNDFNRQTDLFGRYGGDELSVAFYVSNLEQALEYASRVRKRIENLDLRTKDGLRMPISASIGVAIFPEKSIGNRAEDLLRAADVALYHVKHVMGKNNVMDYETLPKK